MYDIAHRYNALCRPSGCFAMLAVDARESMRAMFRDAGRPHADDDLRAFKTSAARSLGNLASAVLCDPLYGAGAIEVMRTVHPETALIVAVDSFEEPRFGPLRESRLDEPAMARAVAGGGVAALKLYLLWRPGDAPNALLGDARRFVERCQGLGVLSLLEGVVAVAAGDPRFDDALVRAAEEFGSLRPDVYKTQLPTFGQGDDDAVERQARRVSDAAGVPWVVLSNGVEGDRFPSAAAAACRGGASGLLAGRGIWRDALASHDPAGELAIGARARLERLIDVVDAHARPWRQALGM